MARSYGRFTTSIYRDEDFRALTFAQQGVYFLLGLQGEVSAAGTLSLTTRRWSNNAAEATPEWLRAELDVLEKLDHVLIDEDTEELLIVKFVKWDGGYTNSKRLPVVREAALSIVSPILRRRLARELIKLGLSDMASELVPDTATDTPSDSASDAVTPSDRVVVKQGEYIPQPTTLNPEPQPALRTPVARPRTDLALVSRPADGAAIIVDEWVDWCPKRPPKTVTGPVLAIVTGLLAEGIDPDDVRRGLAAWTEKGLHPTVLPSVVNEVMNAKPRARPGSQQETDDLFDRAAKRMGVTP